MTLCPEWYVRNKSKHYYVPIAQNKVNRIGQSVGSSYMCNVLYYCSIYWSDMQMRRQEKKVMTWGKRFNNGSALKSFSTLLLLKRIYKIKEPLFWAMMPRVIILSLLTYHADTQCIS